ncbi:MAG: co-chaperone GroES [Simkaniaceae bacterium]|nr:co-chaperone GroES [Simkaniaceae bacterium]
MTKYKPLGTKVVIKRAQAVTTKGGIYLPDAAQEKPKQGEVLAVGPGKDDEKMEVKIGDQVLFGSYAGVAVKGDDDILIVSQDEILAVVE